MNEYVKAGKIIRATTRAYNVVYKAQGYLPLVKKEDTKKNKSKKAETGK